MKQVCNEILDGLLICGMKELPPGKWAEKQNKKETVFLVMELTLIPNSSIYEIGIF